MAVKEGLKPELFFKFSIGIKHAKRAPFLSSSWITNKVLFYFWAVISSVKYNSDISPQAAEQHVQDAPSLRESLLPH